LNARYGIEFNQLYTITNLPISRFLDDLLKRGKYEEYMQKLLGAFNPGTIAGLMCRTMISVDYEGYLYDCDFNQMLEMKLGHSQPYNLLSLTEADLKNLKTRLIQTGNHCYGCTAGAGSSCGGAIT
jgi:radical SAM/Cys-rich protein